MKSRLFALALAIMASIATLGAQMNIVFKSADWPVTGSFTQIDDTHYRATLAATQYASLRIEYNGTTYAPSTGELWIEKTPAEADYSFDMVKSTDWNWPYIVFRLAGTNTYEIEVTVNNNGETLSVQFVKPRVPTPLTVSVGGNSVTLLDDVITDTGTYSYPSAIDVENSSVTIGNIMVGTESYGFATTPNFTTSTDAQTQEINLVKGGSTATLSVNGTYSLSVTLQNGVPVKAKIVKSKVVPVLLLNGTKFVYDNGLYTGTLTLTKGTPITITYNGSEKYYPVSNLDGSDATTRTVSISTADNGGVIKQKGTYTFAVNIDAKTLTYTNTTPLDRSAYSPTLSETFITYESGDQFIPDEINSLWYQAESVDMGTLTCGDQGNGTDDKNFSDFHYGNGHLGISIRGTAFENIMLNEKTHFKGARPTEFSAGSTPFQYLRAGYLCHHLALTGFSGYEIITQQDLMKGVGTSLLDFSGYSGESYKIFKEYFVSHPDDVFAMLITSADTSFGIDLSFKDIQSVTGQTVSINGTTGYFTATSPLETVSTTFACKVVTDENASLSENNKGIKVSGAKSIMILLSSVSNYDITKDSYIDESRDCQAQAIAIVDKAAQKGWEQLYNSHVADHQPLMNACTFSIADNNSLSTRELLNLCKNGSATSEQQRMLDQLLFQVGRYKTIGASRKGDQLPSNLRGIWMSAQRWNGDIHADLNVEMNYWMAENTNLPSCHEAFLDYIVNMSKKSEWKNYAQYRAPGCDPDAWTLDNANSIFGEAGLFNSQYSEANAWFCYHLWQHYQYSLDREYLKRIAPVMMNACKFWMTKMTWDDSIKKWICPDVWSPENLSGGNTAVHARQMVWELFRNTIESIKILGSDFSAGQNYLSQLENKFKDIDPGIHIINNALCEWYGETPREDGHRHLSHLMCLYPMAQVSPYDQDLTNFNAAVNALDLRGDGDGGEACNWQKAWKMACRARALDDNEWGAYHQLELGYNYLFNNLNASTLLLHQTDGNSGITAGIAECLLQSYSGIIDILPVLPDAWPSGIVKGLKAVGNFEIEITWEDGKLVKVLVTDCLNSSMREGVKVRVHEYNIPSIDKLRINGQKYARAAYLSEPNTKTYVVEIPAGAPKSSTIDFSDAPLSGIEDIDVSDNATDNNNYPVEYFDIQGRRVTNPGNGIYIRRQGSKIEKIIIR